MKCRGLAEQYAKGLFELLARLAVRKDLGSSKVRFGAAESLLGSHRLREFLRRNQPQPERVRQKARQHRVDAQDQAMLGARGEQPVRLLETLRRQVVDHD